jgi:hypothetical protein
MIGWAMKLRGSALIFSANSSRSAWLAWWPINMP